MAQLNYFRGQTSGGVPAGLGQATNTGMAVGISKGMDALAKGLEKFFQNKREKAEEDAYAELLKKLNEMPDTKEVGRKSAEEVASGTPGLPDFLDTAMEQESEFVGPMEATPESVAALQKAQANPDDLPQVITQEMSYNPAIEGMMFDPATNQYYPHATDTMITGKGTGQFHITDDGRYVKGSQAGIDKPGAWSPAEWEAGEQPVPQMIPTYTQTPVFPSLEGMQRPAPEYRATEAAMAGQQVPLSFAEQDQMRNQLIADYASRIGADRAEKLMGEQFKVHRDDAGNPVAYSLGKSMMAAPKTDPLFTKDDFEDITIGGVTGKLNKRTGTVKLPTQDSALKEGLEALRQMKSMNRASLKALKDQGTTHVVFDSKTKIYKPAELGSYGDTRIPIDSAIAMQTTSADPIGDELDKD
jgi:hypothetical protein